MKMNVQAGMTAGMAGEHEQAHEKGVRTAVPHRVA